MTGKRLLILGGNRYNIPSIRAAGAADFHTIVADRNPNAAGFAAARESWAIDLIDVNGLERAIKAGGGIDGVVSMAEVGVRPAAELSSRLGLASISTEAAANATSKAAMRSCWAPLGRFNADYRIARSADDARKAVAQLGFPLVFKPDQSFGGSRGVKIVEADDEIADAFEFADAGGLEDSAVVIERRLFGTEHSTEVLIWEGRTSVLCVSQKVKSPAPYRVDLSVQYPAPFSPEQEELTARMCAQAVAALGLTRGVAHIEFCMTAAGPVLMELGARCGGGHTPQIALHVSGVDEFVETCRMACGLAPEGFEPTARRGADYRFVILPPGVIDAVEISDELRGSPELIDVDLTVAHGEEIHSLRTTADRAGFIAACGEDLEQAARKADEASARIRARYMDGGVARVYTLSDLT